MSPASLLRAPVLLAGLLILVPLLSSALMPERFTAAVRALPRPVQLLLPSLFGAPYLLVALNCRNFALQWLAFYALVPVALALLLDQAARVDGAARGNWRDFLVLAGLGLAVDLRWLEPAWAPGYSAFGKMILLDAGIYGFLVMRQLRGVGFDLRLRGKDLWVGWREFARYAVLALPLGFLLGFLHFHAAVPQLGRTIEAFSFTFVCIALPEELFFRGWLENLLERRIGPRSALVVSALLFGLAHWNKRTANFNWRYVLMATLAGIFYGRAWMAQRRVAASTLTHATVDTLWSLWLR